MTLYDLQAKLRYSHRMMIEHAGTPAHEEWKAIVREYEAKIRRVNH